MEHQTAVPWPARARSLAFLVQIVLLPVVLSQAARAGEPGTSRQPGVAEARQTSREVFDTTRAIRVAENFLLALHHANATGNYTVLHDMAAPRLARRMTSSDLADHFRPLRRRRINLGAIAGRRPWFKAPPALIKGSLLWLEGCYPTYPKAVRFKIILQRVRTAWRFLNIDVDLIDPPAPSAAAAGSWDRDGRIRVTDPTDEPDLSGMMLDPSLRGSFFQQ